MVDDEISGAQADRVRAWSRLAIFALIAVLAVLLLRVAQLKIHPGSQLREAMVPRLSKRPEPTRRGDLLDVRGRILATSTVGYRLFVDPTEVLDLSTVAVDIARALGTTPVGIDRKILKAAGRQYVVIEHLLNETQVQAIRLAALRGVGLEPRLVRHYPNGMHAAVGLVGFEHIGLSGSEHAFEEMLAPKPGKLTYLRDAWRRPLWIDREGYQPGEDGRDVRLSLDLVIQQNAERRLRKAVADQNAAGGRLIVLDCRSGEIMAMCDVVRDRPEGRKALARNRCVSDPYEPGSTLKPFVWAVATELGIAELDQVIPVPSSGTYRTSYGRQVRDTKTHGPVSWRKVLVHSINSGMAIVAERMSHGQMQDAVRRFGFGSTTRCGMPGESAGLVTTATNWKAYTQTSVAIGHEIAVTPVQMVRAFSVFARGGTMAPVRIRADVGRGPRFEFQRRVCDAATADLVREVLREVVTKGTGRPAQSRRYRLFGKSGTAQLPRPDGGGYYEHRYVSSFIAGAPYENPRIVVLCVLDDPDRSRGHYGGKIAGPVVRDIVDDTLRYLGVAPDQQEFRNTSNDS